MSLGKRGDNAWMCQWWGEQSLPVCSLSKCNSHQMFLCARRAADSTTGRSFQRLKIKNDSISNPTILTWTPILPNFKGQDLFRLLLLKWRAQLPFQEEFLCCKQNENCAFLLGPFFLSWEFKKKMKHYHKKHDQKINLSIIVKQLAFTVVSKLKLRTLSHTLANFKVMFVAGFFSSFLFKYISLCI